jgi:predicted HNH restriction endonuclease
MACQFNFAEKYGDVGTGYIHVHHVKPVSELDEEVVVEPSTDLAVLCANCHAMIHRKKDQTLTLEELKKLIYDG